jgi:hypothetical protein
MRKKNQKDKIIVPPTHGVLLRDLPRRQSYINQVLTQMATSQITSSYEGLWLSTQTPSQNIYTQNIVCPNEAIIFTLMYI